MKRLALSLAGLACCFTLFAQDSLTAIRDSMPTLRHLSEDSYPAHLPSEDRKVYRLKPVVDVPLTAAGIGWTLYTFSKIYGRDTTPRSRILALDRNHVASINRFGTKLYSPKAFDASNMFFYASMPYPLILLLDKAVRHDAPKVALLWAEALAVTGSLYGSAPYFHPKYRPYAYNPEAPIERRIRGGARNSFFAGHVGLVGTSTFFVAKVFSDYHPDSRIKWLFYTIAGVSTAATGYLRIRAGEHFLTDVLIGAGVGTASGLLIPHFHKVKGGKESRVGFTPYAVEGAHGLALVYRL